MGGWVFLTRIASSSVVQLPSPSLACDLTCGFACEMVSSLPVDRLVFALRLALQFESHFLVWKLPLEVVRGYF